MPFGKFKLGSLGSLGALGTASNPNVPDAPVLTWTSASTDTTPTFNVNLPDGLGAPHDAVTGDVIYLEVSDNISFTYTSTDPLDAGDVAGDIVAMEETTPLTDGTYYARARLKRGSSYGAYSNTVTVTVDATAPTITSSNSISLAENTALSHTLTANETVTWTKTGGADTALFTLAGSNLSMTAKDYEVPTDADTNNTYVVQITATDTAGNATNQTITVTVTDVVEYQGPGDIVSGATAWGSSARAYTAAYAASSGALMDIVDSSGANQTTINVLTTGFCDTTTLAAWVVAHGTASVKKLYDQTGNGNHWTQATVAFMPTITENALNSLPGMTSVSASFTILATANITVAQPQSYSTVFKVTTSGAGGFIGPSTFYAIGHAASANTIGMVGGSGGVGGVTANDNAWHGVQSVINGASASLFSSDGGNVAAFSATGAYSSVPLRLFRAGGSTFTGIMMEAGMWPIAMSTTNETDIYANQHGANGYGAF